MTKEPLPSHPDIEVNYPLDIPLPGAPDVVQEALKPTVIIDSVNWRLYMRCKNAEEVGGIDFFSVNKDAKQKAIDFCAGCIVRPECLIEDVKLPSYLSSDSIVASMTKAPRNKLRSPRNQAKKEERIKKFEVARDSLIRRSPTGYWVRVK